MLLDLLTLEWPLPSSATGSISLGYLGVTSSPPAVSGQLAWNIAKRYPSATFTRGFPNNGAVGLFTATATPSVTLDAISVAASPLFTATAAPSITLGSLIIAASGVAGTTPPQWHSVAGGQPRRRGLVRMSVGLPPLPSAATGSIAFGALGITASPLFTAPASSSITLGSISIVAAGTSIGPLTYRWSVVAGGQPRRRGSARMLVGLPPLPSSATGSVMLVGLGINSSPLFTAPASGSVTLSSITTVGASAIIVGPPQWHVIAGGQSRRRGHVSTPFIVGLASAPSTSAGTIVLGGLSVVGEGDLESPATGSNTLSILSTVGSGAFESDSSGVITLDGLNVIGSAFYIDNAVPIKGGSSVMMVSRVRLAGKQFALVYW